jgi:hypothetical protein
VLTVTSPTDALKVIVDVVVRSSSFVYDAFDQNLGVEHDPIATLGAVASYCTLPLFHQPADPATSIALGHVSHDGHAYTCKNPMTMQKSFHVWVIYYHITQGD